MATINEDYVSLEIAKLLKDKGFDEATNRYYNAQHDQIRTVSDTFLWHWNDEEFMKRVLMDGAIAIPTLQMAMKWLREVHNIFIAIEIVPHVTVTMEQKYYFFKLYKDRRPCKSPLNDSVRLYFSYEEATEAAIKYSLKILI